MIQLNSQNAEESGYARGGTYRVRVGDDLRLEEQANAVWQFVACAVRQPMELILDPLADGNTPHLADLSTTGPTDTNCAASALTLYSSGTTGTPKQIRHDLQAVLEKKRAGQGDARWLLTYAPWRWAGVSVLLHVFKSKATLVVPASLEPGQLIAGGIAGRATHVSLTPSLLRRLELTCGAEQLGELPLQQVTFGGEAATQPVLNTAGRIWPNARISHVYASTEAGDVCGVSDGLEGIPERKFTGDRFAFTDDNELVIDGRATGDLWRLEAGRYYFVGRREEMINVGGAKVSPMQVEAAAMSIDGVTGARAYAVASPLLGQVVALDYVGEAEEHDVLGQMRQMLEKIAWPAQINHVGQIAMTDAGKTKRIER